MVLKTRYTLSIIYIYHISRDILSVLGENSDSAFVKGVDNIQDMTILSPYLSRCSGVCNDSRLTHNSGSSPSMYSLFIISYGTKRLDIFINSNVLISIKTLNTTYIEVPDKTCPSTL